MKKNKQNIQYEEEFSSLHAQRDLSLNKACHAQSENTVNQTKLKPMIIQIKNILTKDFNKAAKYLKDRLDQESEKYNKVILLECRHQRVKVAFEEGRLEWKSANPEYTQIERCFITLVSNIEFDDLRT